MDPIEELNKKAKLAEAQDRFEKLQRVRDTAAFARAEAEQMEQESRTKRARRDMAQLDALAALNPPGLAPQQPQSTTAAAQGLSNLGESIGGFSTLLGQVLEMSIRGQNDMLASNITQLNERYVQIQDMFQREISKPTPPPPDVIDQFSKFLEITSTIKDMNTATSAAPSSRSDFAAQIQLQQLRMDHDLKMEQFRAQLIQWDKTHEWEQQKWTMEQQGKGQMMGLLQNVSQAGSQAVREMRGETQPVQQQRVQHNPAPQQQSPPEPEVKQCPSCNATMTVKPGMTSIVCPNAECGEEWKVQWS